MLGGSAAARGDTQPKQHNRKASVTFAPLEANILAAIEEAKQQAGSTTPLPDFIEQALSWAKLQKEQAQKQTRIEDEEARDPDVRY